MRLVIEVAPQDFSCEVELKTQPGATYDVAGLKEGNDKANCKDIVLMWEKGNTLPNNLLNKLCLIRIETATISIEGFGDKRITNIEGYAHIEEDIDD